MLAKAPKGTSILFAHGAGAPSTSDWMTNYARRLRKIAPVTAFDYPYMEQGRSYPDRMPTLLETHQTRFRRLARRGRSVVLAGKSMGSRVGCHLSVALAEENGAVPLALVCFGYPLVGMSKKRPVRDEVLLALQTPILFVQGTRDSLCPLPLLAKVRRRMRIANELLVVEGGDHSLMVGKRQLKAEGRTQDEVDTDIVAAVSKFIAARN